jgi:flagellar hook protein FlgE
MMRSMYSGVSGLRIHQTKMDVIGNNIANVNTVGFKASRVTFSEVFSQTIQGASGPNENTGGTNPMQIGLGAGISSIDVDMGEGAAQRTDNPLDLKIEGDGFFVVSDITGNKFSRAGAFRLDSSGNMVTPDGMNVMGWYPDPNTGLIAKDGVRKLQVLSPDNLYSEPTSTANVTMSGNINRNDAQLAPANGGVPFTTNIYDSLGYPYTVEMTLENSGTANTYNVVLLADSVTDQTGNTINNAGIGAGTVQIVFDPATGKVTNVPSTFAVTGLNTGFSAFPAAGVSVDFSSITLFSGNTTLEATAGDKNGFGSGNKAGSISGYEIGGDGKILGRYTNGQSKLLGQVVIATFQNPAGLQKIGNNLFEATNNSGEFDGIGTDVTSSGGSFNAGVLEMSNVDLSREFTEMITTQRGFQANSRIITSSDELLQELVNLKR